MSGRLLALVTVLATAASAAASDTAQDEPTAHATIPARSPIAAAPASSEPKPLRGVPLAGPTGLKLLVANNPPFLLDVDSGRITSVGGLDVSDNPVLSVRAVGAAAVLWVYRRTPANKAPVAEIYVLRSGKTRATRLATAWDLAPAADGRALWLKSYKDVRHCVLREVGLDGRERRSPRPLPCSTRLVDAGTRPLLGQGSSLVDPSTGRTLLRTGGVWAIAGHLALTRAGSLLTLRDVRSGARWRLPWPSQIGGADQAAVRADGRLIALAFSDPAYEGGGTQVTDVWLLHPTTRRFQHVPDMPAAVSLKFTSMSWSSDGRLVMLAETGRRTVVALWRPGQKRIAVRPVRLPDPNSGSDSFVVWQTPPR